MEADKDLLIVYHCHDQSVRKKRQRRKGKEKGWEILT